MTDYNTDMIAYIYDEQVLASVYCIKGWRRFAPSFLTTAFIRCQGLLHANNMIWMRDKEKTFSIIAKQYGSFFEVKNGILEFTRSQEEVYETFIKGYPIEFQNALATFTKIICGDDK